MIVTEAQSNGPNLAGRLTYSEVRARALKERDSITEVVLNDTITLPLTFLVQRFLPTLTAMHFTLLSFALRTTSAVLFATGALVPGAVLAYLGFCTDGMDGKLSRTTHGTDPEVRGTTDFVLDQFAFASMSLGLMAYTIRAGDTGWTLVLGMWLALSYIGSSLTSTRYRLLTKGTGQIATTALNDGQNQGALWSILRVARNANDRLTTLLAPLRISPQLTTVESEVLLFMAAPLLGMPIWLGVASLVPLVITMAIFGGAVAILAPQVGKGN